MRCRSLALGAVASLAFAAPFALAHEEAFEATLSGAQATPQSITPATGTAEVHYNVDTNIIEEMHVFTDGIFVAELVGAHIRIGAPGVAGPVAFTIQNIWWGDGVDGMLLDVHVVGPISEADEVELLAGNAYINIETDAFPTGEIRGQLIFVPAPSVAWAFGFGAAALGVRRRR